MINVKCKRSESAWTLVNNELVITVKTRAILVSWAYKRRNLKKEFGIFRMPLEIKMQPSLHSAYYVVQQQGQNYLSDFQRDPSPFLMLHFRRWWRSRQDTWGYETTTSKTQTQCIPVSLTRLHYSKIKNVIQDVFDGLHMPERRKWLHWLVP